ncbi:aminotransferase class I/II-fold pyridoxal phosphate-dependent enzyme [Thermicanus aegyptius]|uniref:methionine gamma-lyase family protein n=1 Tax=Thermicanus aegyptius TaxID=94009 RepID=UPI000491ED38|nr:methionine gamma-lyase family protein [Thermicanus aegyptius]
MYQFFKNGSLLREWVGEIEREIAPLWKEIDRRTEVHQYRLLKAFQEARVSTFHFTPSTGYGYGDAGREKLEEVYAAVFGGEKALVRPQILSGTHAIAIALFGLLRPGDELLYITGKPYDTLEEVIGSRGVNMGSLQEWGVTYKAIPLTPDGALNWDEIAASITPRTKVVALQRSRGYEERPSISIEEIGEAVRFVKKMKRDLFFFVDNCYGEFVEEREPTHVGADLIAGSLIKNPGGGIVKSGGYLVGSEEAIRLASYRFGAPGIGAEGGATLYSLHEMFQGFFLAPHIVGEALKGAVFTAALLEKIGFSVNPRWNQSRTDLVQSIELGDPDTLITFCQAIQSASPVDSFVKPVPNPMPGYEDRVIMAAGTFIQGSSIELTADGPLRPPYTGYVQGGLTFAHVKVAVLTAVDRLLEKRMVKC